MRSHGVLCRARFSFTRRDDQFIPCEAELATVLLDGRRSTQTLTIKSRAEHSEGLDQAITRAGVNVFSERILPKPKKARRVRLRVGLPGIGSCLGGVGLRLPCVSFGLRGVSR